MNKGAKVGLIVGGCLLGFTCAYVAFALVLGVQPHDIPLIGKAFPAPPEVETVDGSLVERYLVDRHTGVMQRGQ